MPSDTKKSMPFDAEYCDDDEAIARYISQAMLTNDTGVITHAIGVAAKARGMTRIAEHVGLSRMSLYKALSGDGNPEFETIIRVLSALGLRLRAEPGDKKLGLPTNADLRRRLQRAYEIKDIKEIKEIMRELARRNRGRPPPPPPKRPNPLLCIQWNASRGKWRVRIRKGGRYVINRLYKTQEAAIAARDQTLATGRAPPGKPLGRPRRPVAAPASPGSSEPPP
jgi:probable addiction module antidote protein